VSIYFFTVGEEIFKVSPALSLVASFAAEGSFVTQATEPLELPPPPLREATHLLVGAQATGFALPSEKLRA
jgi:hypothetical protein